VQLVAVASVSPRGLDRRRTRLDALPGVRVRWFDVATSDIAVKTMVRAFNLALRRRPRLTHIHPPHSSCPRTTPETALAGLLPRGHRVLYGR